MRYFSEREYGEVPRVNEEISRSAWRGIKALLKDRVDDHSFGIRYFYKCQYTDDPIGCDRDHLWAAMQGDIPALEEYPWSMSSVELPDIEDVLDTIEFCWSCIGKPAQNYYDEYCRSHHLSFDVDAGRKEFRQDINRIFGRNGLAYQLTKDGNIERLPYTVLSEKLASAHFWTGDDELDGLLEKARVKFFDSDEEIRREALEELWDAWERLKTLDSTLDKQQGIKALLDQASGPSSPKFREILGEDAKELTRIGNDLTIRHSETDREQIARSEHADYLFHRLFSLIQLILRTKGEIEVAQE